MASRAYYAWQVVCGEIRWLQGRRKLVVVTRDHGNHFKGLLVNSALNEWTRARPHMIPFHVVLPDAEHNFLRVPSYVDVPHPKTFQVNDTRWQVAGHVAHAYRRSIYERFHEFNGEQEAGKWFDPRDLPEE